MIIVLKRQADEKRKLFICLLFSLPIIRRSCLLPSVEDLFFFRKKVPNQKESPPALIRKMRKNYINLYIMCKNVEK
jgi:hypothetical protein